MKLNIIILILFFCITIVQCKKKDNRKGVSKSRTFIYYSNLSSSENDITSYKHTIYIGNYILRNHEDSLFLLESAKKYVDTIKYKLPIWRIEFINDTIDYPKGLDSHRSEEYLKKKIFSVTFNEDSLVKKKYHVQYYEKL